MLELKDRLKDWQDRDVTMFEVAISLSLIPEDADFSMSKGLVLVDSDLSRAAQEALDALFMNGFVMFEAKTDQFKWCE